MLSQLGNVAMDIYDNCGNCGNCGECGNHGNYGKQGCGSCVSGGSTYSDLALSSGCVTCTGVMNVGLFSISSLCKISVSVCGVCVYVCVYVYICVCGGDIHVH